MIYFDKEEKIFHLSNGSISYIIGIEEGGILAHIYYGKAIKKYHGERKYPRIDRGFAPNLPEAEDRLYSLDTLPQEFPGYGMGDFRESAIILQHNDGSYLSDFRYKSYEIISGKPTLRGLPATYALDSDEAKTLKITLLDEVSEVELDLFYCIFNTRNVITRWAEVVNDGIEKVYIDKISSMNIDFLPKKFDIIHLNGAWGKERMIARSNLEDGIHVFDSKRGTSSHQQNPFIALIDENTTEDFGEVYGFNLVYSGSHEMKVQKDQFEQVRLQLGIQSLQFRWELQEKERFVTPEVVMVYSDKGLGEMSRTFHHLYQERLTRGVYQLKERPILVNNWEATYFDFDEEKLLTIANIASSLGIELFVLDDGWFGHRNDDTTSLGDWYEFTQKLPSGLKKVSEEIKKKGMKFGLWFEPEMISEQSMLFEKHPDWAFKVPGRLRSKAREQFVLDFSREEVRNEIWKRMKIILDEVPVDYIKWDMNRHLTDVYSLKLSPNRQGEVHHRYVLGLYELLEKLTQQYPKILFESCSGGGGRFDPGMLYYMPQTWTSDNTDAIARLKIQYGTSLVYPLSSIGAHVSAVPNHQTLRCTSLEIRGNVAMSGVLGYELDLEKTSVEEQKIMSNQIDFYKKYRHVLQFGDFYRLKSPFEGNETAWMMLDEDKKCAVAFYFKILSEASDVISNLKFKGLDMNKIYRVNNSIYGGDELINVGLLISPEVKGDFITQRFLIEQI